MRHYLAIALTIGAITTSGCQTSEIRSAIENAADSAIANTINSSNSDSNSSSSTRYSSGSNSSHQPTVSDESFDKWKATRTVNKFGHIRPVITEKNPKGVTMVRMEIFQKDTGAKMDGGYGYLYKVSPEGWLHESGIHIDNSPAVINSGKYYLKASSEAGAISGEVIIAAGLTNNFQVEVE